jgi:hypothetical protein
MTNKRTKQRKNQHPDEVNGSAGTGRGCAPAPPRELTIAQLDAIDLIITGKTDAETAKLLNVHRVTVTRWRLYCPVFRKALDIRRANVWGSSADRMRALIALALRSLEWNLCADRHRLEVALALLKFAGRLPLAVPDDTDTDEEQHPEREPELTTAPSANGTGTTGQPGEVSTPEAQHEEPAGAEEQTP